MTHATDSGSRYKPLQTPELQMLPSQNRVRVCASSRTVRVVWRRLHNDHFVGPTELTVLTLVGRPWYRISILLPQTPRLLDQDFSGFHSHPRKKLSDYATTKSKQPGGGGGRYNNYDTHGSAMVCESMFLAI